MFVRLVALFVAIALFSGCENRKHKDEREYQDFMKKRENMLSGVDMSQLKEALRLYPEYKQNGPAEIADVPKTRDFSAKHNINTVEYMPLFEIIRQVEDSSQTQTGKAFLVRKYAPEILYEVKSSLKIQ